MSNRIILRGQKGGIARTAAVTCRLGLGAAHRRRHEHQRMISHQAIYSHIKQGVVYIYIYIYTQLYVQIVAPDSYHYLISRINEPLTIAHHLQKPYSHRISSPSAAHQPSAQDHNPLIIYSEHGWTIINHCCGCHKKTSRHCLHIFRHHVSSLFDS